MAHCNTIFSQILKLVPRHEFEALAKQHHQGRAFRTASRWSQFVTLAMAQLSGRNSLRDMIEVVRASPRVTLFVSIIPCIHWMPRPLTYVCPCFHGLTFVPPKVRSNYMSV